MVSSAIWGSTWRHHSFLGWSPLCQYNSKPNIFKFVTFQGNTILRNWRVSELCSFSRTAAPKYHKLQQKLKTAAIVVSWSWRQGVSRVRLSLMALGDSTSFPPHVRCSPAHWLSPAWRCLVPLQARSSPCVAQYLLPSVHVCLCVQISPFLRGHQSCWIRARPNALILTWLPM